MMPIRVVIADDDPGLRDSLRLLVDDADDMRIVGLAADGIEALDLVTRHRPDVALLDVRMPQLTGLEAARSLAERGSATRVVVLTMFDLDEYAYEALRIGASGFLLKNAPPAELLRAIRVAARGDALLAPEVTRRLITRFAQADAAVTTQLGALTERERETLTLIGLGRSNSEIATELFVTPTTVRTYVSRILSKLGARDRAQLVVIAYQSGLVGGFN